MDIHSLATFAKYGSEVLMGFLPRKLAELAQKAEKPASEMPLKMLTSVKASNEMRTQIGETFEQLSADLVKYHREYHAREAKSEKDKLIHGSVSEQKAAELEQAKRLFERLLSIVTTLSECTGGAVPVLEVCIFHVYMRTAVCCADVVLCGRWRRRRRTWPRGSPSGRASPRPWRLAAGCTGTPSPAPSTRTCRTC